MFEHNYSEKRTWGLYTWTWTTDWTRHLPRCIREIFSAPDVDSVLVTYRDGRTSEWRRT